MKTVLIPLGMRCNSATIINNIVPQPRLPFDWTQMNAYSMSRVLQLNKENIHSFWTEYFSQIDATHHHTKTNSWFPHDNFTTDEEKIASVEKYVRRTHRLQDALNRPEHKIFLIFFGFPEVGNHLTAVHLLTTLETLCKENYSVIMCNVFIENYYNANMYHMYEPLIASGSPDENYDWDILTKKIENRLRMFLSEKGYEVVPLV